MGLENVPPSNILNYDETNLSNDPGVSKYIFKHGIRYPERIINYSKGSVSIMFASAVDDLLLLPYVVYKAVGMWSEWKQGGLKHSC